MTASTVDRIRHLWSPTRKGEFLDCLFAGCEELAVTPIAWVVLDEHYHAVLRCDDESGISTLLKRLHGETAHDWNDEDGAVGRQVWYQFWDRNLWTEGDFWSRIHYIHRNPVKHGYVHDPREWSWSSLALFLEDQEPLLRDTESRFPPPRKLPNDDF